MRRWVENAGWVSGVVFMALWFYAVDYFGKYEGGNMQAEKGLMIQSGYGSVFVKEHGRWVRRFQLEHRW